MNFFQIIATLRKLGNYAVGLFPILGIIGDKIAGWFKRSLRGSFLGKLVEKLKSNARIIAAWKIVERFYWRNYSKDRFNFDEPPPDSLVVLRPIFQLCVLLCLTIPLAQFEIAPVRIETLSGFVGNAPLWSIILWMIGFCCAWAALLSGTAFSNRVAYMISAVSGVYFIGSCALFVPRSFLNLWVSLALFMSLCLCELAGENQTRLDKSLSWLNKLVVGAFTGIQLTILTPLKPMIQDAINIHSPAVSIIFGCTLGGAIAFAATWLFNGIIQRYPNSAAKLTTTLGLSVGLLALTLFMFITSLGTRGSISGEAGMLISSMDLTTTYLWPIWYFVGVGIIHKLVGTSKTVSNSIRDMIPSQILIPSLLVLLLTADLISIIDEICSVLIANRNSMTEAVFPFFAAIFNFSKGLIWTNPINTMVVHWLRPVLLFISMIVLVLSAQRKLNSDSIVRLFYLSCLAALLIWEYVFQLSSFARTPHHSVIVLFLFTAWLLWLIHTVGWSRSLQSSKSWPARGRLAIYAGFVCLAITEIHARAASKDFKIVNELFLVMFRGAVDVGLPYFLLLWTSARTKVALATGPILGTFAIGGLTAFGFNILDKLCGTQWTYSKFLQVVNAQTDSLRNLGIVDIDLPVTDYQFLLRAAVYVVLLLLINNGLRRKLGNTIQSSTLILFLTMAFGCGVASFSKTLVELPVAPEVRALLAPVKQETLINCSVIVTYMSYWFTALVVGLSQLGNAGSGRRTTSFLTTRVLSPLIGVAITTLLPLGYFHYEAFLRVTGTLYLVVAFLVGLLAILLLQGMRIIEELRQPHESATHEEPVLLSSKSMTGLIAAIELCLLLIMVPRMNLPMATVTTRSGISFTAAQNWKAQPLASGVNGTVFIRQSESGNAVLEVGMLPPSAQGVAALMKGVLRMDVQSGILPNLSVLSTQSWNRFYPGAIATTFSFNDNANDTSAVSQVGMLVLVPQKEKVQSFRLYSNRIDIEQEQWELAMMVHSIKR